MHIGIIKFTIRIPANQSLKGKRKVVQSLCQKLRNMFSISVAEVESLDSHNVAVIGVSIVSNSSRMIQQVTSKILSYLRETTGPYILQDFEQDIIVGF